jgi:hypothetical protein
VLGPVANVMEGAGGVEVLLLGGGKGAELGGPSGEIGEEAVGVCYI